MSKTEKLSRGIPLSLPGSSRFDTLTADNPGFPICCSSCCWDDRRNMTGTFEDKNRGSTLDFLRAGVYWRDGNDKRWSFLSSLPKSRLCGTSDGVSASVCCAERDLCSHAGARDDGFLVDELLRPARSDGPGLLRSSDRACGTRLCSARLSCTCLRLRPPGSPPSERLQKRQLPLSRSREIRAEDFGRNRRSSFVHAR